MPIPKPKSNEDQNTYVGRCMSAISDEYDTNEQAVAICISTYQRDNMSKITNPAEKVMARVKFDHDFRGIKLADDGLEGACWEGYVAIGMKELDGRMVPNCVPADEEMKKIEMEKQISLADYPWDECIIDQTARYGDEETAKKVCGYIKSTYGGGGE